MNRPASVKVTSVTKASGLAGSRLAEGSMHATRNFFTPFLNPFARKSKSVPPPSAKRLPSTTSMYMLSPTPIGRRTEANIGSFLPSL